jgi:hypothetical protein
MMCFGHIYMGSSPLFAGFLFYHINLFTVKTEKYRNTKTINFYHNGPKW